MFFDAADEAGIDKAESDYAAVVVSNSLCKKKFRRCSSRGETFLLLFFSDIDAASLCCDCMRIEY